MNGYYGKILKVDLTKGTTEVMEPDPELYRQYLGGAGLAAKLFFDMKAWEADPLGPDNPLMIMHGPLSGTTLPGCSRLEVCARSPQTGIWGESSMGGQVSPQFRGTGYDGIIITGASEKPVYLYVTDKEVEIRDASHLWGKDTFETEELVKAETDKRARVMSIGPGGENLVKYAAIVNDKGSLAGRTGMGAVMGSKKLKAVAFRGSAKTSIADEAGYKEIRDRANKDIKLGIFGEGLKAYGSNLHMEMGMAMGDVPVKNWREAQWKEGMNALSGVTVAETILTKNHSCYGCPVSCKRVVKIDAGPFEMEEGPGLEYEGAAALGTLQRCDNLAAVSKANELTDRYGIDCISTGSTIAWATEAFEKGLITKEDTGGLELRWNDPDLLVKLVEMIAKREGFGDQLAEGTRALSEKYGGKEFAIHVKGLEAPMHDPRALWSLALTYATSIRGACHMADENMYVEFGNISFKNVGAPDGKPQRREGKAAHTIPAQNYDQVAGAAVICKYALMGMGDMEIIRDLVNVVTGAGYSLKELLEVGDRIWYVKRAIGNLCGARKEDDILPERILRPHLEGLTSNLAKILNPMMKMTTGMKVNNEKIMNMNNSLTVKYVLNHLFLIITTLGKLLPWVGGTAFKKGDIEEFKSRFVDFDYMIEEFYRLRELDDKGIPRRPRLESLGLKDVADALQKL